MRRLVVAVCVLLVAVPSALADTTVVPNDGTLPWTDPSHRHPLELLAGQVASRIVGRTVSVNCEGETDWQNLGAADADGFVRVLSWHFDGTRWAPILDQGGLIRLSPTACTYLVQFARAATKPTKCSVPQVQQKTTYKTVRYQATVRIKVTQRVKVNGRWVTRYVWVKRKVWKTRRVPISTNVTVAGPAQPCYVNGQPATQMPASYWQDYRSYALSLLILAHEAWHVAGDFGVVIPSGYPNPGQVGYPDYEARAECHGLQWIAYVAQQLGDSPDDASAIAQFYVKENYPTLRGRIFKGNTYWSADCRQDGPMDITPGDGVWP